MNTVNKDLAQRLREQANDLDTGRGDLEQYLNAHPANLSNLLKPTLTLKASDDDFGEVQWSSIHALSARSSTQQYR